MPDGRAVEWPPRGADPTIYLSNPSLKIQHQPQAHSSAPNLAITSESELPKPPPRLPSGTDPPTGVPPVPPLPAAMASQSSVTSSSSQVRVVTTSKTFQSQQPGQHIVEDLHEEQHYTSSGSPGMQRHNIPVQFIANPQQNAKQQTVKQQQHIIQPQFQNPQPFQQQSSSNVHQQSQREFNVPVQILNTPTPPPSSNNPMTQTFDQSNVPHGPVHGMPFGGPRPQSMQQPFNAPTSTIPHPQYAPTDQNAFNPSQPSAPVSQFDEGQATARQGTPTRTGALGTQFQGVIPGHTTEWPPQPQQPGAEDNQTTTYPSNFKLRNEMPIQQERARVVTSQPAFKMTKPMKMRGDGKWPPTSASLDEPQEQEVREFIKPKKQCKDYSSFFAQHQLSPSYTGYRAPPGTQHVGYDESEDATDM
ncbi:hypothetical protein FHG87_008695 [Trinorchestia longiramus]|nr:hypothetical protein FHG87_008695 [Trinorchestia longiramus]